MTGTRGTRPFGFVDTYRDVLATPVDRRLALVSVLSKLSYGMFPVSAVLLLSQRYSYGAAGGAAGVMLLATAVSSPARGRLVTGRSGRAVLLLCLAGYLAGVTGLVAGASERLPFVVVLLSSFVAGLCAPPVGIVLRAHWTAADRRRGRPSGNALESALMDITLITGPVLATWLSVSLRPALPFVAVGVLMAAAVLLLSAPVGVTSAVTPHRDGPWVSRPLLAVFGALFLFAAALSAVEIVLPIHAQQQHVTGYSGWFLASMSLGSIAGALVLGALPTRVGLPPLLGGFAAGACLLGLAMPVSPIAVLAACPLAGLAIGSTFARFYGVLGEMTPAGADGSVQGWATGVTMTGFAVGNAAGAALAGAHGAPAFLFLSPVAGAAAVVLLSLAKTTHHEEQA
ncbi:MFS transporter [Umezawaea sp. NPDC059074]|uniref:MFS transporter n=1 Tax=Umezawaea sp. NPDC059074 TaxID=3346716 RepID=UPI0036A8EE99